MTDETVRAITDRVSTAWRSTVVRKALVAVSGLALWAWVVLHVAGNLTLFSGPAAADGYAAALRRAPAALWAARVGLATALVVHVAGVASLARAGRAARPRHEPRRPRDTSAIAARGMRIGGALLLAFVVYHLLHLTVGVLHPHFEPGRVYDNVVVGLRPPRIAAIYVGAAVLLGLHLLHGLWAAGRSLGIRPDTAGRRRRPVTAVLSVAIAAGFASVPIAVLVGWLR
jgi:succinate dehydrogenase / fumarate reductase, cytochrome b subunit